MMARLVVWEFKDDRKIVKWQGAIRIRVAQKMSKAELRAWAFENARETRKQGRHVAYRVG